MLRVHVHVCILAFVSVSPGLFMLRCLQLGEKSLLIRMERDFRFMVLISVGDPFQDSASPRLGTRKMPRRNADLIPVQLHLDIVELDIVNS